MTDNKGLKYQVRDFKEEKKNKKRESSKKENEDLTIYPVKVEEDKNNQGDPELFYPLSPEGLKRENLHYWITCIWVRGFMPMYLR